jgi:mRNA interferase RelE/StbE
MSSREIKRYRIISLPRFEKDLAKLKTETKRRVLSSLSALEASPYSFKELHGSLKGKYTLRIGDYRLIYTIDEKSETVFLMTITHRRHAYR